MARDCYCNPKISGPPTSAAFIAATYCANNSQCSTSATLNTATAIAQNIGALNGIPAADVMPTIVTSPSGTSGAEALQIKVSTTKFLMITPIEGAPNFLSLTALSYGQIGAAASASAKRLRRLAQRNHRHLAERRRQFKRAKLRRRHQ